MKIKLYILIDKFGKMYYTSHNRELCKAFQKSLQVPFKTYITALKGEINVK